MLEKVDTFDLIRYNLQKVQIDNCTEVVNPLQYINHELEQKDSKIMKLGNDLVEALKDRSSFLS